MDKLKMHTENKVDINIEKIGKLFPNTLTERIKGYDENSNPIIEKAIDFDILKQELSKVIVEGREERYQMNWPGKKEAILTANAPINKTLRPCREESVDFDTTENLYIEGDNLEVLKLLQETYLNKVKMIYIDPPYNTGNDSFVYNDDFSMRSKEFSEASGQYDEDGNMNYDIRKNSESNGKFHTDWLNMMYPRLKLARDLLSDDGVIFISIDSNEVDNLKKICDEIYGQKNFISNMIWINNERGRSIDKFISNTNEYIFMYAKNTYITQINQRKENSDSILREYCLKDNKSYYKKGDPLFNNNSKFNIETRPNLVYSIYVNKKTNEKRCIDEKYKLETGEWVLPLDNKLGDEWIKVTPPLRKTNKKIGCWRWGIQKFENENEQELILVKENSGKYMFYSKNRLDGDNTKWYKYKNIFSNITSSLGTNELVKLLEGKFFDHPKPVKLIKTLVQLATDKKSTILDFFSGSSTTAHAVMQLNAEDGGNRKFIMVQLPEETDEKSEARKAGYENICEIGKERIRRAGKKIKEENPDVADKLDTGFRVLKLDSSNMKDVYYNPSEYNQDMIEALESNIKDDRLNEDLLFQVMLDLGELLSSDIKEIDIKGKKVFNVGDGNIIACFDEDITNEVLTEIAKMQPFYAIFRDSSLYNDSVVTNFEQIFKTYSPNTITKVL